MPSRAGVMGVADILPSPCQLLQFRAASSHVSLAPAQTPPSLEKCQEVWRWLPVCDCACSVNSHLAHAHWRWSRENVEISSWFLSQQHREYFSSRLQVKTVSRVEQFFWKSDKFSPQLEFCFLFPPQPARGADGRAWVSVVSRRCGHKSDKHSRPIKTLLTPPQLTGMLRGTIFTSTPGTKSSWQPA